MEEKEILEYQDETEELQIDGIDYIKETTYRIFTDGTKEEACSVQYPKNQEPIEPEPSQLDRIEQAVNKTQQDIIDEYTQELLESGVL